MFPKNIVSENRRQSLESAFELKLLYFCLFSLTGKIIFELRESIRIRTALFTTKYYSQKYYWSFHTLTTVLYASFSPIYLLILSLVESVESSRENKIAKLLSPKLEAEKYSLFPPFICESNNLPPHFNK